MKNYFAFISAGFFGFWRRRAEMKAGINAIYKNDQKTPKITNRRDK